MTEGLGFDPFAASASQVLDAAEGMAPGPFLQSLLLMVDRHSLSAEDAVRYLDLHERVSSWWASLQTDALVAAAGPSEVVQEFLVLERESGSGGMPDAERAIRIADVAREEVAAALRWSPSTAQHRIDDARLLAGPLAATREVWELGQVSTAHVRLICHAAQRLSTHLPGTAQDASAEAIEAFADACEALQRRVLPVALRQSLSRTRRCADRAVQSIDAAGQAARRAAARCTRDVRITDTTDGISTVIARLDALTARAIMGAVDAAAGDERVAHSGTASERRAEAFATLVLGAHEASAGQTADQSRVGVDVQLDVQLDVAIPVTWLRDLAVPSVTDANAQANSPVPGDTFPDLPDLGRLLTDPTVLAHTRPVIVDDAGHVLDLGRRRYQVSGALRRLLVARDVTCRFPGCGRAAGRCQMDHVVPWDDGGRTDADNLGALCTRHHQLKTHAGWQITASARDGTCTWQSPQHRIYDHHPPPF